MEVILFIEITETITFQYDKPIREKIKALFPQALLYDFDNHSDALITKQAIELVEQATKAVVLIQAANGSTQTVLPFLEKVIRNKEKCLVLFNGSHPVVERMIRLLNEKQLQRDLPEAKILEIISSFLFL